MKKNSLLFLFFILFIIGCQKNKTKIEKQEVAKTDIITNIIEDEDSFYHIDFESYPVGDKSLPIGVFDSGIGGLTVLKAIVNYDENDNQTYTKGSDDQIDFENESFIYLGDQANMPYGNYFKENKIDLLNEHIIKDVQFLMSDQYYLNASSKKVSKDKEPVKAIVIACNTATAYGKENIENFLKKATSEIKVIGVIDAGVRGTLNNLKKDEDAIVGVLATVGTVKSKGYQNTLMKLKDEMGFTGNIEVFSQGGIGIAEAVDEDPDYYDKKLKKTREGYKGPSLSSDSKIDKTLFDIYNFDFDDNKMLCDSDNTDDCSILQINDVENYVRYHLVTLMEKIRLSNTQNKLKSIILGCTHYPYLTDEFKKGLERLYNYKNKDGNYLYRDYMIENIELIDPAVYTAKELYDYLKKEKLFNSNGNINNSEFYISVPNKDNANNKIDNNGRFPYNFKYGRNANKIQEYIKIVPFSRNNISSDIMLRLQNSIPNTYQLIESFSRNSEKTKKLDNNSKI